MSSIMEGENVIGSNRNIPEEDITEEHIEFIASQECELEMSQIDDNLESHLPKNSFCIQPSFFGKVAHNQIVSQIETRRNLSVNASIRHNKNL